MKRTRIFRTGWLVLALVAALAPVYWMLTISLKTEVDQFAIPPKWFSFTPTLQHYTDAFVTRSFGQYLLTSAIVAVVSTFFALLIGTLAAYALTRFRLPWNLDHKLSLWILSTRMFPAIVTAVPLFLMMRDLRLLNTKLALIIVYTAFNLPFVVWMMRGFFAEVPRDLEEAALVDGDSRLGALVRVVLPLVSPGLAATAVFCLIVSWNEFLFALVLTQTDAAMTLPVGIAGRVTQYEIKWGVMSAAGVVAMMPILVFALAMQRYLVRGLSLGAVKG
ncbi:MAG: carbohydrate ABC transporter permease [Acidobacteria bacterium]|nr:carbohydrate ABC transporter permease [Acidobacteriota bacterium]MCA1627139.1 carbohydrate ABC transporter permease [Acidobacteriota bacterium]